MSSDVDPLHARARDDWRAIRRHPALRRLVVEGDRDDVAVEAGLFLAQSLGYCRVYGVELGESDGSLPASIVPVLCEQFTERVQHATQALSHYELAMESATTQEERELYSTDVLRQRMDAWAIFVATEERLAILQDDLTTSFPDQLVNRLVDSLDQYDIDLQARGDLLVDVTATCLLDNWLLALRGEYSIMPPWWLDKEFWASYESQAIESHLPGHPGEPVKIVEVSPRRLFVTPSQAIGYRIEDAVAMAAADEEQAGHFVYTSQPNGEGAQAWVKVPRRYSAHDDLRIEIRFAFPARDPTAIHLGDRVSLGKNNSAIIVVAFPDDEEPQLQASIVLSRQQAEQLELESKLRLLVKGRYWYPQPK